MIDLAGMGKVPHDLGFVEDEATVIENTVKTARRNRVLENKVDIDLENRRDKLWDVRGLNDLESRVRREELEELEAGDDIFAVMEISERAMSDRNPDVDDPDMNAAAQSARTHAGGAPQLCREYYRFQRRRTVSLDNARTCH